METIEIRPIVDANELDEALDLWAEVFPEERSFFEQRILYDPDYRLETTWIAKVNGELASAIQIFPLKVRFGKETLKIAGIGNVGSRKKFRNRHLIQNILAEQTQWMTKEKFDLSLLFTGINPFYEKAGWDNLPQNFYELSSEAVPSMSTDKYKVETLDPGNESQLSQIRQLYEHFNQKIWGSVERSEAYWKGQLRWVQEKPGGCLTASNGQKVVAYLRWKAEPNNKVEISDCCYSAGHELSIIYLLHELTASFGKKVTFTLSFSSSHYLQQQFVLWGAKTVSVNHQMWKIIRWDSICHKAVENFKENPSLSSTPLTLFVTCGLNRMLMTCSKELTVIRTIDGKLGYQQQVIREPIEFISDLLTGNVSTEVGTYQALFPPRDFTFWGVDNF